MLLMLAGLAAILLPAVQQARTNGSHGDMFPASPPDPSNRMHHPTGLSMVAPENWELNGAAQPTSISQR